eukprot:scaffold386_cov107-Skeletonema_dohrnii-CCMP3373.AAC.5
MVGGWLVDGAVEDGVCTQFFLYYSHVLRSPRRILCFRHKTTLDQGPLTKIGFYSRRSKSQTAISYQTNGTALSVEVLRAMSMKESH